MTSLIALLLIGVAGVINVAAVQVATSAPPLTASLSASRSASPLSSFVLFVSPPSPAAVLRLRRSPRIAVVCAAASSTAAAAPSLVRHYLKFSDLTAAEYLHILSRASQLKSADAAGRPRPAGWSPQVVLLFDKHSTRTFASFSAAVNKLNGNVINLSNNSQLKRGESIADTVRALNQYADAWVVRTFQQSDLDEFAALARGPVINALTNDHHPCQILADILTFIEHRGPIAGKVVAWIGDGNNMAISWAQAAAVLGFKLQVATPAGYEIPDEFVAELPSDVYEAFATKEEAVTGADIVTTDVWTSMGFEDGEHDRRLAFAAFQVDADLIRRAAPDALFMHCLPVHRGEEVTAEVVDGPQSVVWDEAANRLYVQMAVLEFLLDKNRSRSA